MKTILIIRAMRHVVDDSNGGNNTNSQAFSFSGETENWYFIFLSPKFRTVQWSICDLFSYSFLWFYAGSLPLSLLTPLIIIRIEEKNDVCMCVFSAANSCVAHVENKILTHNFDERPNHWCIRIGNSLNEDKQERRKKKKRKKAQQPMRW